jgi:hypothetical protein
MGHSHRSLHSWAGGESIFTLCTALALADHLLLWSFQVGFRDRSKVHVAIFYCAFDDDLLVTFNTLLSLVTDVFIVLFESE